MKSTSKILGACHVALSLVLLGLAGVAQASTTTTTSQAQPNNSPGLTSGLLSSTGLSTSATIGTTVGGIAAGASLGGGGGKSQNASLMPAGTARFALSGETGAAAASGESKFNAWLSLSQNRIGYSFSPLNSSGTVDVGIVGVDYTFGNKVVLGLAVAGDSTDVTLNFATSGKLNGRGLTASPYLGIPINPNWSVDASVGSGRTKINTNVNGVTGNTTDERTLGNLGVAYRQAVGNWLLTGRGAYLSVHDKLSAYSLSDGTAVPASAVTVSQVRLSGQALYNAGNFYPYAGFSYIRDTQAPDQAPVSGQTAANDHDGYQILAGVHFRSPSGLYGGIQAATDQGRKEVKNDQILLNLGLRF
jgi:hypothetical protein